jgi:hypothetical protein
VTHLYKSAEVYTPRQSIMLDDRIDSKVVEDACTDIIVINKNISRRLLTKSSVYNCRRQSFRVKKKEEEDVVIRQRNGMDSLLSDG